MSDDPIRILVVDDDPDLRELLIGYLAREGFSVSGAEDGRAMDEVLEQATPDLILLDLMLPGEDGLSIARRLRQATSLPIIMLSARGDDIDRIVGLEVGADDYVAKPFNPRELLARIRAVLRRKGPVQSVAGQGSAEEDDEVGQVFVFGPYRLDLRTRELQKDGEPVAVTGGELDLLAALTAHPNRVLDRDRLLDLLKGYERSPFDRSIDVHIARLRAKIEPDTKRPQYIRTVWGKGYMFTPQGES
jgi:DNA-binding response OmpR family regulator